MEHRLRIEKVQNGFIFTNEDMDRFVDGEPKLAFNQIIDRVTAALDNCSDVIIVIATPDKPEPVGNKKGY